MRLLQSIFILFILTLLGADPVAGQDSIFTSDIKHFKLPALQELMDSAALHSPGLKFMDMQVQVMENDAKTMKRDWLDNIGVEAAYRYGNYGNLYTTEATASTEVYNSLSYSKQNTYSTGVYLRLPLADIVDRKNRNRTEQLKVEQSQLEKEKFRSELNERIIIEYNRVNLFIDLLKIKSESLESANLQILLGEKQFRNGTISLLELSSLQEKKAKAASEYLIALSDAKSGLMVLEEICGIRILN